MFKNFIFTEEIMNNYGAGNDFARLKKSLLDNDVQIFRVDSLDKVLKLFGEGCYENEDKAEILKKNETVLLSSNIDILKSFNKSGVCVLGYAWEEEILCVFPKVQMIFMGFEDVDFKYINKMYLRKHKLPVVVGETDRCIIRETIPEDMEDIFSIYVENHNCGMEPLPDTKEERCQYGKDYLENMYGFYDFGMWTIVLKETMEVIGRVGCVMGEFREGNYPELGYIITSKYQNTGLGYEVTSNIIEYMEREFDFESMYCVINKENILSVKLAKKLKFSYDGEVIRNGIVYERYYRPLNHTISCKAF